MIIAVKWNMEHKNPDDWLQAKIRPLKRFYDTTEYLFVHIYVETD